MAEQDYLIKVMSKQDLLQAIDWAAAEGWNPGLYDIESFHAADPNGFLVGYLGDEAIASISVVKYDDSYGFLGFYIVKPEYRGKGYGFKLWQAGLQYLEGCNVGLDGVVEQQGNYKQSGFKLAYGNIRFEGVGGGDEPEGIGLVDLSELPLSEVLDYDAAFFPTERKHFLRHWISQTGSRALGIKQAGKLVGYGVIRPCRNGFKIGPLFADDALLAEELFLALRAKATVKDNIYLDVPEVNLPGVALAEKYSMEPVFTTARMYTGDTPDISVDRTFGVTTFELG
ncbi:GNAT family N-acetyltransferase [Photobacterium rosenbergii]|uniref:GNAT family N-acetyltransferase n=1 Tax=Photobacterium rosenbergii TaxID=294936 RepID=A0ABU3ZD09_9GAMM|nr:GNAT family N-acetyltransferase [Photobacterium rosenbergii]MDV5167799.1 GNAT family N-acetyltransferase [Photobacterium rosenbergii]